MTKVAIVYGTSTGVTEGVAYKIKNVLGVGDLYNVRGLGKEKLMPYDFFILGTSTTGFGDLLSDWKSFLPEFQTLDFVGKKVALFGLGDSSSYSNTFANGMAQLYDELKDKVQIVGFVSTDGYTCNGSDAVVEGKFVGLALDEINETDQTEIRINNWITDLKRNI